MSKLVIILLLIGYLYHLLFVELEVIDILIITQLNNSDYREKNFHKNYEWMKNFVLKLNKGRAVKPSEKLNSLRE